MGGRGTTQIDLLSDFGRRHFLKTGLGAIGGALIAGPAILQGCASSLPATHKPYRSKFNTIAHEVLDIELEHKLGTADYLRLDKIIGLAQENIPIVENNEYAEKDIALLTLYAISDELDRYGFEYDRVRMLCYGLEQKRINCDCYSALYLAIGEALNLPLKMVRAPAHTFVRWQLNDDDYINWETTIGSQKDDEYYILRHNIAPRAKGISSLKSLDVIEDRREILANAYVNSGVEWLRKCRLEIAIARFHEAIRRDPKYETPYYNIGLTYYHIGKTDVAIKWCREAIRINPNHIRSHAVLQSAYKIVGKKRKSRRHFKKVLELDPSYYKEDMIESRVKSKRFC